MFSVKPSREPGFVFWFIMYLDYCRSRDRFYLHRSHGEQEVCPLHSACFYSLNSCRVAAKSHVWEMLLIASEPLGATSLLISKPSARISFSSLLKWQIRISSGKGVLLAIASRRHKGGAQCCVHAQFWLWSCSQQLKLPLWDWNCS